MSFLILINTQKGNWFPLPPPNPKGSGLGFFGSKQGYGRYGSILAPGGANGLGYWGYYY